MNLVDYKNISNDSFKEEINAIISKSVSIGALLAGILVPFFSVLDFIFKQQHFTLFLFVRIAVSLCAWIIYAITFSNYKKSYYLGALLTIIIGGSIALMCYLDLGPADPYYAGINLPILGFGILLPMTLKQSIIPSAIVWLLYVIPNLLILDAQNIQIFISNNFFIVSTIVISAASSRFHLRQRKAQWLTNNKLATAHNKIESYAKDLEKEVDNRTKQALQSEKLAAVGQLAGGIAHDFNNILTAILGTSQILLQSLHEDDPLREDINTIYKAGTRAVDLVKQLLAFSKNQVMQPKVININEILLISKRMLSRIIGEDIKLIVNCCEKLKFVKADPVQIEQIIFNLAVNARDAMANGGTLTIETSNITLTEINRHNFNISIPSGDYVILTVSDTGTGMQDDIREKIFEPFFTTKESLGTGLGLSTVYGIVKQSGGYIICQSKLEQGTTFKIFLPVSTENGNSELSGDKKDKINFRGTETILLVEDEDEVRKLTARILKKFGYTVLEAEKPVKAIAIADQFHGKIDLLLTDIIMPDMNGKALADKILGEHPDIKVLFTSGYINNKLTKFIDAKFRSAFLQKPFTMEELTSKIRTVLNHPANQLITSNEMVTNN
ncbi:response regulator [bacterium]|nr:response regulator [bacterium]